MTEDKIDKKVKEVTEDFEEAEDYGDDPCSTKDKDGNSINICEDELVTYCQKCRRFYIKTDNMMEEIFRLKPKKIIVD